MTPALLLGIGGLALMDSLNPATTVAITLILITSVRRPALCALAFVGGAFLTVLALGLVIFVSAGAAADIVSGGVGWLRRIAFGIAAIALVRSAYRRLRSRPRRGIALPPWFSPGTAVPLGVVMTGADLPNAFPYFIAIERLIAAGVQIPTGVLVLTAYATIYCLPCLVLLTLGMAFRERVRGRLHSIVTRFSTGTIKKSVPMAVLLVLTAIGVGSIAAYP